VSRAHGIGGAVSGNATSRINSSGLSSPAVRLRPEPIAVQTAMDQHPTAVAAYGHGDWFRPGQALGPAVTGDVAIEVPGPEAFRPVVAVRRSGCVVRDLYSAVTASG